MVGEHSINKGRVVGLEALPSNIWVSRVWLFVVPQQEKKAVPTIDCPMPPFSFLQFNNWCLLSVGPTGSQSVIHPSSSRLQKGKTTVFLKPIGNREKKSGMNQK